MAHGIFAQAAFRHIASGQVIPTGRFHDVGELPCGGDQLEDYDQGFVDHFGRFFTREEARTHVPETPLQHDGQVLHSQDLRLTEEEMAKMAQEPLAKSLRGYKFAKEPELVENGLKYAVHHNGKEVGHVTLRKTPQTQGPGKGHFMISGAHVHALHREKGLYSRLLHEAAMHVKKTYGALGIYSPSEWREDPATRAWKGIARREPNRVKIIAGRAGPDFFMSEKPLSKSSYLNEDLEDAISYVRDGQEHDPGELKFQGVQQMDPADFIDDMSHFGRAAPGWLKQHPEERWASVLEDEHSRPFDHIIAAHKAGAMAPGIQIDGYMGDGRGRAIFHHALGLKMPVAIFSGSKSPLNKTAHDTETDEKHLHHEFVVEYRRWLKLQGAEIPTDIENEFDEEEGVEVTDPEELEKHFAKAEADLLSLAAKHGNLKSNTSAAHHEVAQQMSGYDPEYSPEFAAARFIAGGEHASEESVRTALILYDMDFELAALRAYGLPRNEHYREMLRAAMEMMGLKKLKKSDDLDIPAIPRDIKAATPEAEGWAVMVRNAMLGDLVEPVQFDSKAKHSKGTAIATDPESDFKILLKPGSGQPSPAAGVREEPATQSAREVAFSKVAQALGLGDFYPKAELLLIDGKPVAALELLDIGYQGLDKVRRKDGLDPVKLFTPYQKDGTLFKWAMLDWMLGNPDRHANNLMLSEDGSDLKLIDHGSAFAGEGFDPAHDTKSFTPFYLRAWSEKNWTGLTWGEREAEMPRASTRTAEEFGEWVDEISVPAIEQILREYDITPHAVLARLEQVKQAAPEKRVDELLSLWAGSLS